jgi:hypothetical protein
VGKMKILYTSAIIPQKFDQRKKNYEDSYYSLLNYFKKEDISIIECFLKGESFLDELGSPVFISNTHDPNIMNKGVLEINGIGNFLKSRYFKSDELLLKVTGRYKILDGSFIKLIGENPGYDFYGKLVDKGSQVFTGCFCSTESTLREFIEEQDLEYLEKNMINIEKSLLDFLKNKSKKCFFVETINILSPIFGTGEIETLIV